MSTTASELAKLADVEPDERVARRARGVSAIVSGASVSAAARSAGMDRGELRKWRDRFLAEGVAGLKDRPAGAPRIELSDEQFDALVDCAVHGIILPACTDHSSWRGPRHIPERRARPTMDDLQNFCGEELGLNVSQSWIRKLLNEAGLVCSAGGWWRVRHS